MISIQSYDPHITCNKETFLQDLSVIFDAVASKLLGNILETRSNIYIITNIAIYRNIVIYFACFKISLHNSVLSDVKGLTYSTNPLCL